MGQGPSSTADTLVCDTREAPAAGEKRGSIKADAAVGCESSPLPRSQPSRKGSLACGTHALSADTVALSLDVAVPDRVLATTGEGSNQGVREHSNDGDGGDSSPGGNSNRGGGGGGDGGGDSGGNGGVGGVVGSDSGGGTDIGTEPGGRRGSTRFKKAVGIVITARSVLSTIQLDSASRTEHFRSFRDEVCTERQDLRASTTAGRTVLAVL